MDLRCPERHCLVTAAAVALAMASLTACAGREPTAASSPWTRPPSFSVMSTQAGKVFVCPQGPAGTYNYTVSVALVPNYPSVGGAPPGDYPADVLATAGDASHQALDLGGSVSLQLPSGNPGNCTEVFHVIQSVDFTPPGSSVTIDVLRQVTITQTAGPPGTALDRIVTTEGDGPEVTVYYPTATVNVDANFFHGAVAEFYNVITGKTFTIGYSSMEGHLTIRPGTWFNGGYSFKFKNNSHVATQFTVTAKVDIPVTCPYGGGLGGTISVPLGTATYSVAANNTSWLPTGDQNSILSWMNAVVTPDLCGGFPMDNAKGALFTATVSQSPATGSLVDFRFKYRDPAAKGKLDTNCTDPNAPMRDDAATCGASWSQTVTDP